MSMIIKNYSLIADCEPGWTYFAHTQHCYRHFEEKVTWWRARNECRKFGNIGLDNLCMYEPSCATLATVHDHHTNKFLESLTDHDDIVTSEDEESRINWIGGIYAHGLNAWSWDDASSFDYRNFENGEGEPESNDNKIREVFSTSILIGAMAGS